MKNLLALAAVASVLACSAASAATLVVTPDGVSPNNVYTIYLEGQGTTFNGAGLSVKPDGSALFENVTTGNLAGAPRPAGDPFTYRNRLLDADGEEFPDSKGWTLLGVVNSTSEVAFSGGPLGELIDTTSEPGGRLFLANIMLTAGTTATASLQLVNGVDTVHTQSITFGIIPEPTTIGLASVALLGLAALRRRSA